MGGGGGAGDGFLVMSGVRVVIFRGGGVPLVQIMENELLYYS